MGLLLSTKSAEEPDNRVHFKAAVSYLQVKIFVLF